MELRQRLFAVQVRGEQVHFAFEVVQIFVGAGFVFCDDFVAAAVVADGVAKGDVDVERQGFVQRACLPQFQCSDVFLPVKIFMEAVCCRVGSVTRTAGGQRGDEFPVEFGLFVVRNSDNFHEGKV